MLFVRSSQVIISSGNMSLPSTHSAYDKQISFEVAVFAIRTPTTQLSPVFYNKSRWPLTDVEVGKMRGNILYNQRKFRILALTRNHTELESDPVVRTNVAVFRSEFGRQIFQRSARLHAAQEKTLMRSRTAAGTVSGDFSQALDNTLPEMPSWELTPFEALVGARRPVNTFGNPNLVLRLMIDPATGAPVQPRFRVFIYDEKHAPSLAKLTQGTGFCHNKQWGSDVGFYDFFRQSAEMTEDPEVADFFFVPGFALCLQVAQVMTLEELGNVYRDVISELGYYFTRNQGRDHIFTLHYVDVFREWRKYAPHSIFLTPETEIGWEASLEKLDYYEGASDGAEADTDGRESTGKSDTTAVDEPDAKLDDPDAEDSLLQNELLSAAEKRIAEAAAADRDARRRLEKLAQTGRYNPKHAKGVKPTFDTRKDLATPPYMDPNHVLNLLQFSRRVEQKKLLAAFAGKLWADVTEA